jgi:hypothetical protein
MDDRDKWPSVVNEQFTQAWINLKELPGGMMQSNQPPYRYGPIPGTQSCLITTSPREADLWRARGDAVLTICTCGVALPEVPRYRCGHCGYEGPCSGNGYSAPWCKQCQRNDRLTPVSGVAIPAPEPGLIWNPHYSPSEEGTHLCTCESYPHKGWCGRWMRSPGVEASGKGVTEGGE